MMLPHIDCKGYIGEAGLICIYWKVLGGLIDVMVLLYPMLFPSEVARFALKG